MSARTWAHLCLFCGAADGETCRGEGALVAHCPREMPATAAEEDNAERAGYPMPGDLTPNEVFGVGGRCRRNYGGEHQFEVDWHGGGYDLRCRWCGKREQP